ncbi:MAG: phosphoribosylglycinamide formyltransferase [Chitinophagaceae bacterium]
MNTSNNIAIFASGAGSNALKIVEHPTLKNQVKLIVCNKPNAGVLSIAQNFEIPVLMITKTKFDEDGFVQELRNAGIDKIVLAGFLWKIPLPLIKAYPNCIINIHPALLPKYGGKGMYGHFVHEAVLQAKEKETGITIHYVDEFYDHGQIIMQANCTLNELDNAHTVAKKVQVLEHKHFAVSLALLWS